VIDGERLYRDVVEANPPLIVWLNLPAVWLSRLFGLPDVRVYNAMVLGLAVESVLASRVLLARLLPEERALQRYLTLALIFILLPLVRANFGQREHVALALLLPLALLTALRIRKERISTGASVAIGVAAGVGIALKPYFMLPWLALEVCVWLGGHRFRPRPETLAIVATGAGYLAAVSWLAPEYWTLAPLMAGGYYDFLRNSLPVTALIGEGAAPAVAALLTALVLRREATHPELWVIFGALTTGFYVAAVAQHKGWEYHFYPAYATGVLLFALVAVDLKPSVAGVVPRAAAAVARAAVVAIGGITVAACVAQAMSPRDRRYDPDPDFPELLPLVAEHSSRGSVLVLSWSAASAFPLISEAGARSASRFVCLWMMGGLYGAAAVGTEPMRYRSPPEMGSLERYLNDAMAQDLARNRPSLVLALVPAPDQPEWRLRRIDLLAYLTRNENFAAAFRRYTYVRTVGQYWMFERLPEDASPAPPRKRASYWDPSQVRAVQAARSAPTLDPWPLAATLLFILAFGIAWSFGGRFEPGLRRADSEVT